MRSSWETSEMNSSFSRSSSRSRSFCAASSSRAGLRLGAGTALGGEQEAALLRVLAQAPVLRRQLPGDPVQDREQ